MPVRPIHTVKASNATQPVEITRSDRGRERHAPAVRIRVSRGAAGFSARPM